MIVKQNKTYLILALATAVGLLFHGASFFNTLEDTYDIYVHMFFADHYSKSWFEPWEDRWYTGFNLISYPPIVHQTIALFSYIGGLKFGAYLLAFAIVLLYVTGAYRFSKLVTVNEESAGYAALVAVFCPSVIEALHVFGQLPTVMGIGWLLHSLPEIYLWVRFGKWRYFLNAISIIAVAVGSHHVTPIFGMVFFVLPVMATAVMDGAAASKGNYKDVGIWLFIQFAIKYIKRIIIFGLSTILATIFVILPYWIWSKNDPITQVPIPHGSRDSFFEVFSSGLVFFIIPWGFFLLFFPFLIYRFYSKRNLFLGFSFTMLFILGTGGTTPVPKMLLGENAFSILTLERFTFWGTILSIPLIGEFLWRFFEGNLYQALVSRLTKVGFNLIVVMLIAIIFFSSGFTMNLSFFRPLQPDPIELTPITNFLQSDKHYKWRYLTLGFGDQMALLSANTQARTIDGNYHSARRIPELTTRAIERLENSKYRGVEGIGTLQQFLTAPDIFHLKYVLSNDKFYDPLLYFTGWHRVKQLSNGIMVWERADVSPLPSILPKKDIPRFQKIMWGTIPISMLFIAFFFNVQLHWLHHITGRNVLRDSYSNPEIIKFNFPKALLIGQQLWVLVVLVLAVMLIANIYWVNQKQDSPEKVVQSWYNAIDFKKFDEAHSYLDPMVGKSLDQFLLETSVTDGLVDSYGKLNTIQCTVINGQDGKVFVKARLHWVTALEEFEKTVIHETVQRGMKWYMVPEEFNYNIPTNQFFDHPGNQFYNQGRRTISTEETFHEDVLDRPVVAVEEAKLVRNGAKYAVIGAIQNIDDYPADITIKATLMDSSNNFITSYYDKFYLKHKLLPKERTVFRIDFESVGWLKLDSTSSIYDPEAYESMTYKAVPSNFKVEILSTVATQDLYHDLALEINKLQPDTLSGTLFNHGNLTATMTQLLRGFSNENGLFWVDHYVMPKSVFPRRKESFQCALPDFADVEVIASDGVATTNGLESRQIEQKYRSSGRVKAIEEVSIGKDTTISIQLNPFIANPGSF